MLNLLHRRTGFPAKLLLHLGALVFSLAKGGNEGRDLARCLNHVLLQLILLAKQGLVLLGQLLNLLQEALIVHLGLLCKLARFPRVLLE